MYQYSRDKNVSLMLESCYYFLKSEIPYMKVIVSVALKKH